MRYLPWTEIDNGLGYPSKWAWAGNRGKKYSRSDSILMLSLRRCSGATEAMTVSFAKEKVELAADERVDSAEGADLSFQDIVRLNPMQGRSPGVLSAVWIRCAGADFADLKAVEQ